MRIRWWALLIAAAVGAGGMGVGWWRAAQAAASRVEQVNAKLTRERDAALASAGRATVQLDQTRDSVETLLGRIRVVRSRPSLPPRPPPGSRDELPQLRAAVAVRDARIAEQDLALADAETSLVRITGQLLAARDTVAALRQRLADSVPPAPCPPPLEPPRRPSGVRLGVAAVGLSIAGETNLAAVAELGIRLKGRLEANIWAGPAVTTGDQFGLAFGGRVGLPLFGR